MGRTSLHYAMATRQVEQIGKMLIKAGANRQIRDVVSNNDNSQINVIFFVLAKKKEMII